jgi:hypothetical protein
MSFFLEIRTTEMKAAAAAAAHAETVKAECSRRIYAILDAPTVSNVQGAVLAGELDDGEMAVFRSGRAWVNAMLEASRAIAANPDADPTADTAWPAVPDGMIELAARF